MLRDIPVVRKSVVQKYLTPKLKQRNRISIVNLLSPENGSRVAVPSKYNRPNVVRLHEDLTYITDTDSTVFCIDADKASATEHPSISEF